MRRLSFILLGLATSVAFAADPVTILLVRHAEKASAAEDTAISPKGVARAKALAEALRDVPVSTIYTSQFLRTKQTAQPVAADKHLTPEIMADAGALAGKLREGAPGSVTLVVHHSNTVPELVAKLGGGTIPPIVDAEFDRLVIVTLTAPGQARVLTLRYGGR
jgi:broad specificity phosphatase PhoE